VGAKKAVAQSRKICQIFWHHRRGATGKSGAPLGFLGWRMADYTADELSALRRALASGTLVVRTGDHEVRYGSFEDLRARIAYVEAKMAAAVQPLPVVGRATFRRS